MPNQVVILSIQQMIDFANGGMLPGTGILGIPPIYINGGTAANDHSGTYSATVLGEGAALNAIIAAGFSEDYITSAAGGKKEYYFTLGTPHFTLETPNALTKVKENQIPNESSNGETNN